MGSQSNQADINEAYLCQFLACDDLSKLGNKLEIENIILKKSPLLSKPLVIDLKKRAKQMSDLVKKWMHDNYYAEIEQILWLKATTDAIYKTFVPDFSRDKYPSDILLICKDKKILGISAKSSKSSKAKPPIKNPGLGTVLKTLGIQANFVEDAKNELLQRFPEIEFNKIWLRQIKNSKYRKETILVGGKIRQKIRDKMYELLKEKQEKNELSKFILEEWIDIPRDPPYIKVWGYGTDAKYGAKIIDPLETKTKLESESLSVDKSGFSVNVMVDNKKIIGFRSKYESEQMASGLKFSVDVPSNVDYI